MLVSCNCIKDVLLWFQSYSEDFEEEGEGLESNTHKAAGATPTTTTTPSQRKGGGTALSQGGGGGEREILELMQAVEAENQLIAESSKESHVSVTMSVYQQVGRLDWLCVWKGHKWVPL